MALALLALGLVLVVEGLLWALFPGLAEDLLASLRALDLRERRMVGLLALGLGVLLVWAAALMGASLTPS